MAMTSSMTVAAITKPSSNQSCFSPIITLIPSTSSLTLSLLFRRSQGLYISSYLQLNCNNSLSTITKWTIRNCTTNCNFQIRMDQTVITTSNELFIPAKTLAYGTCQLTLTVSMVAAPNLSSSASAFVKIISSGIIANLVQFGTSMITHGYQQDLLLDPGTFSVDPDATTFNSSNWKYEYSCRIYGRYDFPSIQGVLLTIDDPRIDPFNPSSLSNRSGTESALRYGESSLTILSNSLQPNQTYQFMVSIKSRQNSTLEATGYLLVQMEENQHQMIVVTCVISTLCTPNVDYQFVNPTTQVALFSVCIGTCTSINNITWNVYYGEMNSSSDVVRSTLFNQINQYQNIWFFGSNTSNFTSTNYVFISNSSIEYWRFKVIYVFATEIRSSALNF